MAPYVIMVEFTAHPDTRDQFLQLVQVNAAASLRHETGCERFDVLLADGSPDTVLLYEIYSDRPAFELHCASRHFRDFDVSTRHMVANKKVVELTLSATS